MNISKYLSNPHPILKEGTILNGRFEIIGDTVNAGGFGRIYKAIDRKSKSKSTQYVAVKEFYVRETYEDGSRFESVVGQYTICERESTIKRLSEKFHTEAKLLCMVGHQAGIHTPEIIRGIFVFEENNTQYYVMSYKEGKTLTEWVLEHGAMEEAEAVRYITQIGKVLYHAHHCGLLHRDISPNNIIIDYRDAILVDFGNAKSYNEEAALAFANQNHMYDFFHFQENLEEEMRSHGHSEEPDNYGYATGQYRIGTPGFSAPPAFNRKQQGDVFSLAATLFFALTGENCMTPFGKPKPIAEILESKGISTTTIAALQRALRTELDACTPNIMSFICDLPNEMTIESLLNY